MRFKRAILLPAVLITFCASQFAYAQTIPSSLKEVHRVNKIRVNFSKAEKIVTSRYDLILPYNKQQEDLYTYSDLEYTLPSVSNTKPTVLSQHEFFVDEKTYCKNLAVDFIEVRRYSPSSTSDWGTVGSKQRKYASKEEPCPRVGFNTWLTNMALVNAPGLVRPNLAGRAGWEVLIRYKSGHLLGLRFISSAA